MKFKINEYEYEMDDSPETKDAVFQYLLENYIKKYDATAGEVIGQDDDCQIHAWEVLAEIVDDILKITCIGED